MIRAFSVKADCSHLQLPLLKIDTHQDHRQQTHVEGDEQQDDGHGLARINGVKAEETDVVGRLRISK